MTRVLGKATLVFVAIAALAAIASAQTRTVEANIPFAFTVGDKVMPAGDYIISSDLERNELTIRGSDNNKVGLVKTAIPEESRDKEGNAELIFSHYGTEYFLSQVWDGDTRGLELRSGSHERELAQQKAAARIELAAK